MDRLNLDRLHEITEKTNEKLLYSLLSEEEVTIDYKPHNEGLVELFLEFPESIGYFLLSLAGNCIFAFPVLGMGSLLLFPRLLKLFTLIGIQTWFTYFWVFHDLTWVGFFPLVIVYITFQIHLPKIKQRAAEEDGI